MMASLKGKKVRRSILLTPDMDSWVVRMARDGMSFNSVVEHCIAAMMRREDEVATVDLVLVELQRQGDLLKRTLAGVERLRAFASTELELAYAPEGERPKSFEEWIERMERMLHDDGA